MLVISHNTQHQILFPHIGIAVISHQDCGRLDKLEIDAPNTAEALCEEFAGDQCCYATAAIDRGSDVDSRETEHRRRRELDLLKLELHAIQRRIDHGEFFDPVSTLQWLLRGVNAFEEELARRDHRNVLERTGRPVRLLILEDIEHASRPLARLLAQHGFDVHVGRDKTEVLRQLRLWGHTRPDLILMDIRMPLSVGLETLHRIRDDERLADLQVFAVAGGLRKPEDEPVGRGWDQWFQKPINVHQLIECIVAQTRGVRQVPESQIPV